MSKQNPETLVDWYEQWLNQIKKEGHFAERIVEQLLLRTEYERIMEIITKLENSLK